MRWPLRRPGSIDEFLRDPTEAEWQAAIDAGWPGTDGSSSSPDLICGVRIGITSTDYRHVELPASRHDWRYLLGRTFRLGTEYRCAADWRYPLDCWSRCVDELWPRRAHRLPLAWEICWHRWAILRAAGWWSFTERQRRIELAWSGEPGLLFLA